MEVSASRSAPVRPMAAVLIPEEGRYDHIDKREIRSARDDRPR